MYKWTSEEKGFRLKKTRYNPSKLDLLLYSYCYIPVTYLIKYFKYLLRFDIFSRHIPQAVMSMKDGKWDRKKVCAHFVLCVAVGSMLRTLHYGIEHCMHHVVYCTFWQIIQVFTHWKFVHNIQYIVQKPSELWFHSHTFPSVLSQSSLIDCDHWMCCSALLC